MAHALRRARSDETADGQPTGTPLTVVADGPTADDPTADDPTADGSQPPTPGQPPTPIIPTASPGRLKRRLVAADAVTVTMGLLTSVWWQPLLRPGAIDAAEHTRLSLATLPVWLLGMALNRLYLARAVSRLGEEIRRIVNATAVAVAGTVTLAFGTQFKELSRMWMLSVVLLVPTLLIIERLVARALFARMRRRGRIVRPVLLVGTDREALALLDTIEARPELGYRVVGLAGPTTEEAEHRAAQHQTAILGGLADVDHLLATTGAGGVMISLASVGGDDLNRLTRGLTDAGYHVALSSGLRDIDIARFRPQDIDGRTLIYVEPCIREGWRALAKRAFDVAGAAVLLLITAPALVVAAFAIRWETPGPVIFSQVRVGKDGRPFRIFKLRTMGVDAEAQRAELAHLNEVDGPLFKMAVDPRVTRVGAFLRKTSIDELPQLVNVLRGEMSMVGPRPALPDEAERWDPQLRDRLRVLPGITGLWQVSGRSDASFDEYRRLDLYYVDNWSLGHDLRIVARTFGSVLAFRGAR